MFIAGIENKPADIASAAITITFVVATSVSPSYSVLDSVSLCVVVVGRVRRAGGAAERARLNFVGGLRVVRQELAVRHLASVTNL